MTVSLGSFIKKRRVALKKTGRQLARESGVSSGYLSQIEAGRYIPKPEVLKKLAKPLHIDYDQLLLAAGVLAESLAEDSGEYRTSPITVSGPRLTLPIVGQVPKSITRWRDHLGEAPYVEKADFAVQLADNSLIGIDILRGDIVYIKKQSRADKKDLVLAEADNQVVLRIYHPSSKMTRLRAANKKFKDISGSEIKINIIGVKVAVLRY